MQASLYALSDDHLAFGGERTLGFFEGHDGAKLRYALFRPETAPARGTVVIVHGRNECIEKYLETIRDLTGEGFAVATFDLRGQALSGRLARDPRAGHIRRFGDYVEDVERFLAGVVEPACPAPVSLLAHSLGGLVALTIAPKLSGRIARMVLSAPLVGLTGLPVSPRLAFSVAAFFSMTGFGERMLAKERGPLAFDDNPLTSCETRFGYHTTLRETHRDLGIGPPTARWLNEIRKAMAKALRPEHLTRITVPTLVLAPVRDGVVPFAAMERLTQMFRASRLVPITGARHELLMESDRYRAQAMAALLAFLPKAAENGDVTD